MTLREKLTAILHEIDGNIGEEEHYAERIIAEIIAPAVAPLVAIADAYDASGLDEARPEWATMFFDASNVELYSGRGGKRLLTLADCLKARDVVR